MADKIVVKKINEVDMKVSCDTGMLMELKEHFTFYVDGYKFMPKYKSGMWDGTISPVNLNQRTLPVGLYYRLNEFCTQRDYELEVVSSDDYGSPTDTTNVTETEVDDFIKSLNVYSGGQPLPHRDYQLTYVYESIRQNRLINISPTGSGKSLIIYCLIRWYLELFGENKARILLIVPNLSLIEQMFSDFKDYSSHNGFDVDAMVQVIKGGKTKDITKPVVISTWQSLSGVSAKNLTSDWYCQFQVAIVDETHQARSTEICGLMNKLLNTKYRFGLTGSLDKSLTNKMIIQGIFGDILKVTSARDLINRGFLSDVDIKCIVLKYGKETKRLMSSANYQTEILFLTQHAKRNKFIRDLTLNTKGNTLLLYTRVESHGKLLYDLIKEKAGDREVFFIHGNIDADERELCRQITEKASNAIIVASTGTFAVGINIKRLHNIIFASPTKSVIRVMQSLGRGLRKAHDKDRVMLYDIADALYVTKGKTNTTMNHFTERLSIYNSEEHPYTILELQLENDKC